MYVHSSAKVFSPLVFVFRCSWAKHYTALCLVAFLENRQLDQGIHVESLCYTSKLGQGVATDPSGSSLLNTCYVGIGCLECENSIMS